MRGKAPLSIVVNNNPWITPAYAGKSCKASMQLSHHRDHPRLCGEKPQSWLHSYQSEGSPPPMRGKDSYAQSVEEAKRITPAYAGKRKVVGTSVQRK